MEIPLKKESVKLNHIDQLRGIAILLVILVHVYQSQLNIKGTSILIWNFGVVGVQLFFVLSAYTLCLSMNVRKEGATIAKFYLRRFFRIAPLYYLGILIYYFVSITPSINQAGNLSHFNNYTISNVVCNVLFIHGLVPVANNTIVPGGWSIGTEMLFYLIFPAIFSLYQRIKSTKVAMLVPILALLIANLYQVILYYFIGDEVFKNIFYYNSIINQLPVFTVGMSYYFLEKAGLIKLSKATSTIGFIVFFLLSFVLMFKLKSNINLAIFTVSISFCFLFKLFHDFKLSFKLLTRIGQLSFSIYIFHFLFAYPLVSKIVTLLSGELNAYPLYALSLLITLTLSMITASLSESVIEKPGIRLGKLLIKKLDDKNVAISNHY